MQTIPAHEFGMTDGKIKKWIHFKPNIHWDLYCMLFSVTPHHMNAPLHSK